MYLRIQDNMINLDKVCRFEKATPTLIRFYFEVGYSIEVTLEDESEWESISRCTVW